MTRPVAVLAVALGLTACAAAPESVRPMLSQPTPTTAVITEVVTSTVTASPPPCAPPGLTVSG